jgi:DNA-binding CsgD family transcriptional regulator
MECPLTDREREVLKLLNEGLVYKQIALRLGVSISTVRTHLHGIYPKLGVYDRAQAVLEATRRGWLQLDPGREPQPGDRGRCEICGNEFPTETGRCAACESEIEDQLVRMGVFKEERDWRRTAGYYLPLMQPAVLHLRQESLEAGIAAAREPYNVTKQDLLEALRGLRGTGTRAALLKVAGVAIRWAARFDRPEEEPDLSVEFDSDRVAEAIVQRHAAA